MGVSKLPLIQTNAGGSGGSSITFQVNGSPVSSFSTVNFENGTDITVSNPSAGNVQFAFTGQLAQTINATAHEFLTSYTASTGVFTAGQPAFTDISGTLATASQLDHNTISLTDSSGLFTISGSPAALGSGITISGFASQTANTVLRSGSGSPSFSALVVGDLPTSGTWGFAGTLSGGITYTGNGTTTLSSSGFDILQNTTAATSSVPQSSPLLQVAGTWWGSALASATDKWNIQDVPTASTTLASGLTTTASETSGVVTVNGTGLTVFAVGSWVMYSGFTTLTWLNGLPVQILTSSSTKYTFNDPINHANQGSVSETAVTASQATSVLTLSQASGSAPLGAVQLLNNTAYSAISVNASPQLQFSANYSGGLDTWSVFSSLATGVNGVPSLNIGHTGSTGTKTIRTIANTVSLADTTLGGSGNCIIETPSNLVLASTGGGLVSLQVSSSVNVLEALSGSVKIGGSVVFGWTTGTDAGLGLDTGLSRISAGVLGVGTGAQGSVAGALQLTRLDGASANADMQGSITSASGTTVSKTFATNYTSTPIVTVTPTTNAGAFYLSSVSNSGFTITYATSGAQTFNYHVIGNPS